jgi:ParB family chromosome partitioning protein
MSGLAPLLNLDELEQDAPLVEEPPRMALDLIDEDPDQPRTEFDPVALQELADSIAASGGVKSPVSLRPHPFAPGRYMLNFGARRLRASRLAGLPDIPYFIDRKVDSFDQVAENEQREPLTALELALFIKARLDQGMTQADIARRLGKNRGFVSKHAALIDAPAVVLDALRVGKLAGVNEAYELGKLHASHPEAVEKWAAQQQEIPRSAIVALRDQLESPAVTASAPGSVPQSGPALVVPEVEAKGEVSVAGPATPMVKQAKVSVAPALSPQPVPSRPALMAKYKGQPLELDLVNVPPAAGHLYGRRPGSPRRLTVPAGDIKLTGFARV